MYYQFHPRAGEDIYIVGTRSHRRECCYVTRTQDGRHELIPAWMNDPKYEKISLVSKPAIEIRALKKTVLVDQGAIYDLNLSNDRLLLNL